MPDKVDLEKRLWVKAEQAMWALRDRRKNCLEDVFSLRYYIPPSDLWIANYLRPRPIAAFNPGALLRGDKLLVFPRLVFDYYSYTSSIGVFELAIQEVLTGKISRPLETKIILWPHALWEFGHGCEDPRVSSFEDSIYMLYTGAGHRYEGNLDEGNLVPHSVQGFAELDSHFEVVRRGCFSIVGHGTSLVPSMKDSALLATDGRSASMLVRPDFRGVALCWRAEADLGRMQIPEESLEPVFVPEKWEHKVGWSTNAVEISEGEYLVGWHGVAKDDLSYKNGLALVDRKGKLLAISDYLLAPRGLEENYGDRPFVIFGGGLVSYEDHLIWIGGISDYAIGIFIADLNTATSRLKGL